MKASLTHNRRHILRALLVALQPRVLSELVVPGLILDPIIGIAVPSIFAGLLLQRFVIYSTGLSRGTSWPAGSYGWASQPITVMKA